MPDVYLLVGLTGAGKTTYSKRVLEPAGVVRLSVDELIYNKHGRYGIDYPASVYFELYAPALETVREALFAELARATTWPWTWASGAAPTATSGNA